MKITVNRPSLPLYSEFEELAKEIWDSNYLTNFGTVHNKLLHNLELMFRTENIALCNNGTNTLIGAVKIAALPKKKKVITTPFTFAATAHSILWADKQPVFVDIAKDGFCISPETVEPAIDSETAAILPVHCYGLPCDIAGFSELSRKTGIPIIYDAAHAFGVEVNGKSLICEGSASIVSTHATKAFNTVEGGIAYFSDEEQLRQFTAMTNFGINKGVTDQLGFNGKLSELHAAVGLLGLKYFSQRVVERSKVWNYYHEFFSDIDTVETTVIPEGVALNYAYYPVKIGDRNIDLDEVVLKLAAKDIIVRKYFSELLTEMPFFKGSLTVGTLDNAAALSNRILCLPIHENYVVHQEFIATEVLAALKSV
jgi:dTDP-4-amino-4,6-dideoxygalactose transaminase